MIDVVIFAVIAAVLVFKLWSKLGKSDDDIGFMGGSLSTKNDAPKKTKIKAKSVSDATFTEVNMDGAMDYSSYGVAGKGLEAIKLADMYFDPSQFLQGAEAAFEMILAYFAEGNKKALKSLLGADLYKSFCDSIDDRQQRGEVLTDMLIGVDKITITDARCVKDVGTITVSIHSQQVQNLTDKNGALLEGDEQASQNKIDIWVFERKLKSKDPNWLLMGTDSTH